MEKALRAWLGWICALIVAMVVVGGITRLTRSGLSIVEWKPVSGVLPPLSEAAWQAEFAKYQKFPEYQQLNHGMTLSEFKFIFFWEYVHRLLGRLIGFVFLLPFLVFLRRGWINRRLGIRLALGFAFGGLQGALGWYMVKSGLVKDPHVSHYRLAAHLALAFGLVAYLFWIRLSLAPKDRPASGYRAVAVLRPAIRAITILLAVQILYGAFTAGLHAGWGFNTFPTMNGEWFPTGFFRADLIPSWLNALENPIAVQFIHRWVGTAVLFSVLGVWIYAKRAGVDTGFRRPLDGLLIATLAQFGLGVATLLLIVPVSVATLHQLGACLLLLAAVRALHATSLPVSREDRHWGSEPTKGVLNATSAPV